MRDMSKLDEKGCRGAPDLIVEIVSPTTAALDYKDKLNLYEKHRVKEYWIVHPVDQIVMLYTLRDNTHYSKPAVFSTEDILHSIIFPDLKINLAELFK